MSFRGETFLESERSKGRGDGVYKKLTLPLQSEKKIAQRDTLEK